MANVIHITVGGIDELNALLDKEPQAQVEAMVKAQTLLATQAVAKLSRGLSTSSDKRDHKSDGTHRHSKKGEMPRLQTGGLRDSIGYKNIANNRSVYTRIGSGVGPGIRPVEYAKYLEGRNHDGIRPFLWAIKELVTSERLLAYFDKYYKPLTGKK